MKICLFILSLVLLFSCNNSAEKKNPIKGKWKVYQTRLNGRDISKSSDPKNENGIAFGEQNAYESFGNLGHQDKGVYSISNNGKTLTLSSGKGNNSTTAKIDWQGDSLQLEFKLDNNGILEMGLYNLE